MSFLKDIRLLECGLWMQVPFASMALADLGADVIKVESKQGSRREGVI